MNNQIFVKLDDTYYLGTTGLEGVIVKGYPLGNGTPGDSVFVYPADIAPFMREEHRHLSKTLEGEPAQPYLFTVNGHRETFATCDVVDNPFAHWNALKSGELH